MDRWQEANLEKNIYKEAKKSIMVNNNLLIEQEEQQKIEILKLKARLSEARREIKLQIHN